MLNKEQIRDLETKACDLAPLKVGHFNPKASLPYGLTVKQIQSAMQEYLDFHCFINKQLHQKGLERFETMLMPANFSSVVGEFMSSNIPKYCKSLVKNRYHNGHPDLLPKGKFPEEAAQHVSDGIEVKASRYLKGWQGHNPENVWLMVFVFDGNRLGDLYKNIAPKPFKFLLVLGAKLTKSDWLYSGRSETSRRTITASVTKSGYQKMQTNWIYRDPSVH